MFTGIIQSTAKLIQIVTKKNNFTYVLESNLKLNKSDIDIFNEILNYDDQRLYDFIFKKEPLDSEIHENFIETNLKKFNEQGNF